METNISHFFPKYFCEYCDIKTGNVKDYNKHVLTAKHKKLTTVNTEETSFPQNNKKTTIFTCENCNKEYFSRVGLWKHKKHCVSINKEDEKESEEEDKKEYEKEDDEYMYQGINIRDKDALVLHLLKQNGDLQNKIIEMASQASVTNNNNTNTNSHNTTNNNTFNLNFFLNETCKNAMNITDFVSSIQTNLDDLENTGRCGYIEGISNIIVKNLNKLEYRMRPLHCSDFKREILYIKDNNEWIKESENNPILTKAIKIIANENIKQISKWKDNYPDCTKSNSKKNDLYLKIVSNSMNGLTKEESEKNINKIITNVAKKVIIEK
jgi:hypothetical protein